MYSHLPWKEMQTMNNFCGQVEDLVNARIKYPRLNVIPLLLVLSAKTFHNFSYVVMALAPHDAPPTLSPKPKNCTNPDTYLLNP